MNNYIDSFLGFIFGLVVAGLIVVGHYLGFYHVPYLGEYPDWAAIEAAQKPKACVPAPGEALLSPPAYAQNLPETLQTNRESEVRVAWEDVPGAKGYRVILKDMQGKVVKRYSTNRTTLYLQDIPNPGDLDEVSYKVSIATTNADDKDGAEGEERLLRMKRLASVTAPTVKNIVIED